MSVWLVELGSAVEFAVTLLLLITALVCLVSAIVVPANKDAELRFEKRLEYTVFAIGAAVLWALFMFAPR
ncbi:hypothetical protein JAO78_002265 [Alishewanella sp. 16-MA]|uniref:Transmembrane protein n=1 Tax=Alishewanella maricola TaxID=2795740 RepID=A0ABS8BZY5_9ALTE|nr:MULTISPECIES: hypothetical protein [Gammaproteobacteria]MDP4945276.1 hypothetical protein [Alishewanella sp.]MDP5206364.1 hypothetical protein [Alishewanella sp. SMS9]MCB5225636.1 hypothetical protein [Alishewanella maricola]MCF4008092.1 hypothetical protein [Rheinheimera sp. UJ63]MDP5035768.1 hypothetical protein [Alishewanella sp.]